MLPAVATAAIAWIHVFGAIGWLGAVMAFGMVVGPNVAKLSPTARLEFFSKVAPKFLRYAVILAGTTLLFGVALTIDLYGHLFNPLSNSGIYIMIGAALALITFLIGLLIVEPAAHRIAKMCESLLQNPGPPPPEFAPLQKRFQNLAAVGMILLILVLVFMIAAAWT